MKRLELAVIFLVIFCFHDINLLYIEPLKFIPYQLESRINNISLADNISEISRNSYTPNNNSAVNGGGHIFAFQKAGKQQSNLPPPITERSFMNESSLMEPNESSVMDYTFLYDPFEVQDKTIILFTVRVLYDYKSQAREELDIKKDQLIPVTATHDDGYEI